MFNINDYKKINGNILKIALGKRIVYIKPEMINEQNESIYGYQVYKSGDIRYSKHQYMYYYTISFNQVVDYVSMYAD